ncbi:MAG: hypothetical protein EAZ12_05215 [Sphingobacteriia bacterium]|nr:MAG: hypothetical protein EAZ12_05215 [Sphingobacteriia bacterium]
MINDYIIAIFLTLAIIGTAFDFIKHISKNKNKVFFRACIYLTAIISWAFNIYEHIKKIIE